MTKHPAAGCTKKQREAFERIGISDDSWIHPKTIEALLKKGLIERVGTRVLGKDRFGEMTAPVYAVPLPLHIQWCEWASEQPEPEETP